MDSAARRMVVNDLGSLPENTQEKSLDKSSENIMGGLFLDLLIEDLEVVAEVKKAGNSAEQKKYALQALKIGVLALKQARGEIDVHQIKNAGDQLIKELQHRLDDHGRFVQEKVSSQLKDYFDPESGRLHERLKRLLQKDGELETILQRQIGEDNSELVRTLTAHIGGESPVMKLLDPRRAESLPALIKEMIDEELKRQSTQLLQQFSLDQKDGALSRFLLELTTRQGELSEHLHEKVDRAIKEFSLDDDNSALNRLLKNVNEAQTTIKAEFSLNEDKSALSKLKQILEATQLSIKGHLSLDDDTSALSRIRREMMGVLKEHQEVSQKFQEEVRTTMESMKVRREESLRGTVHGLEFEEQVSNFLMQENQKFNDMFYRTGNENGLIARCKTGDCVTELGPESIAPGSKIVVEAKQMGGYTLKKAQLELEEARNNRGAQIGLFVFSQKSAPVGLDVLIRLGDDVFVIWDSENPQTDAYFKAAYTLARALCVKQALKQSHQAVDFMEIDQAILEIEKKSSQLDEIETWATTIKNNTEKILTKIASTRKSLDKQVETLREKTATLKASVE
jgi:hypothetical protein